MTILTILGTYFLGFLLTLLFFSTFGKKIGFDYSGPHDDDTYYDDWQSNKEAYTTFSLLWLIMWVVGFFVCIWYLLTNFTSIFVKD